MVTLPAFFKANVLDPLGTLSGVRADTLHYRPSVGVYFSDTCAAVCQISRSKHASGVQGENAYLFIAAATDRQWSKSEKKLKKMADTFRA